MGPPALVERVGRRLVCARCSRSRLAGTRGHGSQDPTVAATSCALFTTWGSSGAALISAGGGAWGPPGSITIPSSRRTRPHTRLVLKVIGGNVGHGRLMLQPGSSSGLPASARAKAALRAAHVSEPSRGDQFRDQRGVLVGTRVRSQVPPAPGRWSTQDVRSHSARRKAPSSGIRTGLPVERPLARTAGGGTRPRQDGAEDPGGGDRQRDDRADQPWFAAVNPVASRQQMTCSTAWAMSHLRS